MIKRSFSIILLYVCLSQNIFAQSVSAQQQKTYNNYLTFVNKSIEYVIPMMDCLYEYYGDIRQYQKNPQRFKLKYYESYKCSPQLEVYYYQTALQGNVAELNALTEKLWQSLQALDKLSKDLDIYIRLEDYQKDQLKKSDEIIQAFVTQFQDFRQACLNLHQGVWKDKIPASTSASAYLKAQRIMLDVIQTENEYLYSLAYHFQDDIYSGFDEERLIRNINLQDDFLLNLNKPAVPYPSESMFNSFLGGLMDQQESKRNYLNGNNYPAQQNSAHHNQFYDLLINQHNGILISFYNNFVDYSKQNGQYLLYQTLYCPVFKLNTPTPLPAYSTQAYSSLNYTPIGIVPQKQVISSLTFNSLNFYMDFISESVRQNNLSILTLRSYHLSSGRFKNLSSYEGKGKLSYQYPDYKIPVADFQRALHHSKFLPTAYQESINAQLRNLMNILVEIEAQMVALVKYTEAETYKKDNLAQSEQILKRMEVLFKDFDDQKERMYEDLRKIFESYPRPAPLSSWHVSGDGLLKITDLNKDVLFTLKRYYRGESNNLPSPEQIEAINNQMRELISKEYENMKGIERIGRNNGNCPYNPYEDLPNSSKQFAEKAAKLKPNDQSSSYRPKYDDYIYMYNGSIIYEYNKFGSLSKPFILKHILQPFIFQYKAPEIAPAPPNTPNEPTNQQIIKSMEGFAHNNLVFLLDVSSSMSSSEKLPLLKKSIHFLLDILRPEDELSLVVYSGDAQVIFQGVSAQDKAKILAQIEQLKSGGNTNGEEGLKLAYKTAQRNFKAEGNNRIILATDGEFYVPENLYDMISKNREKEIYLSIFSFGAVVKKSDNLIKLSEAGQGNYEHITPENAEYKLLKEAQSRKKE
ncbi:MAG: VWA domain-containing protein [Microscillaceae bacterium]|nr:VWA domain-containing protein [Microscillaceae bacterium]